MTTDIASAWNPVLLAADWSLANGDLVADPGLKTAVIISLFTDRAANADDPIPDGTANRRGTWMDAYPPQRFAGGKAYPMGSRLWLLRRSLATQATANAARGYCQEALQWLIDDDVADSVTVVTALPAQPIGTMTISIRIAQGSKSHVYDLAWRMTG